MVEIKNRWTGALLLCLRRADLSGADLRRADLSGADLSGANLRGADLSGANLRDADLRGADLRDADLRGADLRRADLGGANLSGADLGGANLSGADLRRADLRGADLRSADLRSADLRGADLQSVLDSLGIQTDPTLPARMLSQIEAHPESWSQETWHCDSRHCIYGWATELSGPLGKYMDRTLGTFTAATLLLWRPGTELPSCSADATEGETLGRLRVMAAAAAAEGMSQ